MNTQEINVLFWDKQTNYYLQDTQTQLGIIEGINHRYKKVYPFYSIDEYIKTLLLLHENDLIIIFCHIDFKNDYQGYKEFDVFLESYPELREKVKYVSSNKDAHADFLEKQSQKVIIYTYSDINEKLKANTFYPFTKKGIDEKVLPNHKYFKYGIITALYKNEFEEVENLFDWKDEIATGTIIYKIGNLKGGGVEVVACFASKTGMIEASIITTDLINRFHPEFILMPGVCGGSDKTQFGSVIVALKVFIFQKGKVSDLKETTDKGNVKTKLLYNGKDFDQNKITDQKRDKVKIIIEKFELESESIDIDPGLHQRLEPKLKEYEKIINIPYKLESEKIKVEFEPMACSMMVIDKEDYFTENITSIDRKTMAVEMESYGVARATRIADGGRTKFLIFKSVMDKTNSKTDSHKEKAAFTSAQFLKCILEDNTL